MKAFPSSEPIYGDGIVGVKENKGMDLRDWFAGKALTGLLTEASGDYEDGAIAELAYGLADAMMKAREKK
jgi:hypothetical protein